MTFVFCNFAHIYNFLNLNLKTQMNYYRSLRLSVLAAMAAGALSAAAEALVPGIVVVRADGSTSEMPISKVARVDFGASAITIVPSEDGAPSQAVAISDIDRINFADIKLSQISDIDPDARLAVWPTLTSGIVYASGTDAAARVDIFDMAGRLVASAPGSPETIQLDISGCPAGHYILRAGQTSVRIVKK